MKYILTDSNNNIYGPYDTLVEETKYYLGNGTTELRKEITGVSTISEVSDDWVNPELINLEITKYNNEQKSKREGAYQYESDPVFMLWQRNQATEQEWLDAVAAVKAKFPYKPYV